VVLFKDKINFKLAGGDGFKPHQDQQAGWSVYAPLFVTALVAIDDATEANGCLELAAGHHTRGLIGREWAPLTDDDLRGVDFVPYPTAPGDTVFFDSYVPHRSGPNLSHEPRRVLYVTYTRGRRDHWPAACREAPRVSARLRGEPGREYVYRV
jgi:ectoine hydroxylase-related dioxygenase (phytanoyl-CoA dioxygenase family)